MTIKLHILILLLVIPGLGRLFAQDTVAIGLQKQLLVDDYVIGWKSNIQREIGHPEKISVVMEPSVPTDFSPPEEQSDRKVYPEFGRRLSVVWNDRDGKYQMLYRAAGEALTGYAESTDGLNWLKPFISQDGKSNLITYRGKNRGTFYEAAFMIDPTLPWGHPEKYKAAFNPGNVRCAIAYSEDGIHWTGYNKGESVTGRAADTFNQILWDPVGKRYLLLTRTDLGDEGGLKEVRASRIMAHVKDNDLMAHPKSWKTLVLIKIDDPQARRTAAGIPALQMESLNLWVYEDIYFGLMHVLTAGDLTGSEGSVSEAHPDKRPQADVIDYYIGTSRNGSDFDLSWVYAGKPFIPRGPDGSFDQAMVQPSSQIITRGEEHLIYYTGQFNRHHTSTTSGLRSGVVGLAKLPLDRFICQQAGKQTGTIVSKSFVLSGNKLEVNTDASDGWIRIELLDAKEREIAGFSGVAAKKYQGVDDLKLTPEWSAGTDLSSLKGKRVRLKFTLQNSKLYAFQLKNRGE